MSDLPGRASPRGRSMSSLQQLEAQVRALPEVRARGDAFEAVVLRWRTTEPDLGLRAAWPERGAYNHVGG